MEELIFMFLIVMIDVKLSPLEGFRECRITHESSLNANGNGLDGLDGLELFA